MAIMVAERSEPLMPHAGANSVTPARITIHASSEYAEPGPARRSRFKRCVVVLAIASACGARR
jgi:hypothetical protein